MRYGRISIAFTINTSPSRFCTMDRLPSPHYMPDLRQAVQIFMPENNEDICLRKAGSELAEARDSIAMGIIEEQETTQQINHLLETSNIPYITVIHERRGIVIN